MQLFMTWFAYTSIFVFGWVGCLIIFRSANEKASSRAEAILWKTTALIAGVTYLGLFIGTVLCNV